MSSQHDSFDLFRIETVCNFHWVRLWDKLLFRRTTRYRQLLRLSIEDFQKLPWKVGTEKKLAQSTRNISESVYRRSTEIIKQVLLKSFCWQTFTKMFLFSEFDFHNIADFSATNKNLCTFFAAGTISVRKNGALILPIPCESVLNILSRCQPINTSVEWKLYLSKSNHLVDPFSLELNVFGFSNCQSKSTDGEVYEMDFSNARVPQVNINTKKKKFWLGVRFLSNKCLIVHVICSTFNFSLSSKFSLDLIKTFAAMGFFNCHQHGFQSGLC